jgi:hypothetical protein
MSTFELIVAESETVFQKRSAIKLLTGESSPPKARTTLLAIPA